MTKSDEYRANAAQSMKLAATVHDPNTRLIFVQMAEAWLRLAEYAALNKVYAPGEGPKSDGSSTPDVSHEPN